MGGERIAYGTLLGGVLLAALADPALAQGYDSVTEELIRSLNAQLLYMAIPITVLVEGILIYTVWKFKDNDEPEPTKENRRLEISWTIATALVLLVVGYASYGVLASEFVAQTPATVNPDGESVEVEVVAQRYFWSFDYRGENVTAQDTAVVPANTTVYFNVTSRDWLHSFHVPELGLKQDALPGQHNVIKTRITDPGEYRLYCAEYCGVGHSRMLGTVEVVPPEEYEAWLDEQRANATAA